MTNCKHFGRCGGCVYLDIPYQEELTKKEAALRQTLESYGHLLEAMIPAPSPQGYRNKMELAFGDESKHGNLALGIRKRRSYYEVATPEDCVLIPDDFKKIAKCVQDYFRNSDETFFHRKRHTGSLRHLVLRRGEFTGELLIILSTTSALKTDLAPLIAQLKDLFKGAQASSKTHGQIVGILHSINDGVADAVKDENTQILYGRDYYNEEICGLKFTVSAYSFFQINSAGANRLYGVVNEMAANDAAPLAYDLYCGTGTIAQIISPIFEKVIGIELNPAAIEAAKENAKLNNITNCEFYAGDVQDILMQLNAQTPATAIVDPPRDGLHPKALAKLIALAPETLIYVACKPASLTRDLMALTAAGYKPIKAIGVDMFPRTPHVECVMYLSKTNG